MPSNGVERIGRHGKEVLQKLLLLTSLVGDNIGPGHADIASRVSRKSTEHATQLLHVEAQLATTQIAAGLAFL